MHVVQDALRTSDWPRGGVATIGNYDGIHRGQRAVLDAVVARATELGVPSVVLTFDPHPLTVLAPGPGAAPAHHLGATRTPARGGRHRDHGGDSLQRRGGGDAGARLRARLLAGRLALREIYVGRDFRFGHEREGDLALLEELGRELRFQPTPSRR